VERGSQVGATGNSGCDSVAVKRTYPTELWPVASIPTAGRRDAAPNEISDAEWEALISFWRDPPSNGNP